MSTKRKIEITVETHQMVVIRRNRKSIQAWCNECGEEVEMIRPEEAAALPGTSSRIVFQWIEDARVHFSETPEGSLLICINSLLNRQQKGDFQ